MDAEHDMIGKKRIPCKNFLTDLAVEFEVKFKPFGSSVIKSKQLGKSKKPVKPVKKPKKKVRK